MGCSRAHSATIRQNSPSGHPIDAENGAQPNAAAAAQTLSHLGTIFISRCGSESHDLLVSQGNYWIYTHSAPRWNVACDQRHGAQQECDGEVSQGIGRRNVIKL